MYERRLIAYPFVGMNSEHAVRDAHLGHAGHPVRVGPTLTAGDFADVRRRMELDHFKWDAQVGDTTALASFPLLIERATWTELAALAEGLTRETLTVERELAERPDLHRAIALPRPLRRLFGKAREGDFSPAAARVMRFDFHFTTEGWRVSEVNSDVPGGYTEASALAALFAQRCPGTSPPGDPTRLLVDAIARSTGEGATVALTCAPGHIEDQQVVALLASKLRARGCGAHVVSPHHLRWIDGAATIETAWCAQRVDAIVRFFQVEWLARLSREERWAPLFTRGRTPVANPGVAALSESKRLPLVWDALKTPVPTWRALLPETRAPSDAPWQTDEGWLLKEAYGNTGDTVSIRASMSAGAWVRRALSVRLNPGAWLAQRRFVVVPLAGTDGLHACVGVYTVDGVAAGAYARVTRRALIDGTAIDAALLVNEAPK